MARLWDMVKTGVSGIPGTGSITTGSALPGFDDFTAVPDGTTISYGAGDNLVDGVYLTWEVGRGVYTAGVLTRSPLYSSDGGTAVNLSAAAAVWIAVLAEDLNLTIAGNTAGTTSMLLPNLTLVGGNNITLSGDGSAITIDGNAGGGGGGGTFSLYALGNTTGQSTSTSATALSFRATGNVSLGYSAGSILVSAAGGAQTAPTLSLLAVGNTTGTTTSQVVTGSLTFSGAGGVSVGYNAGSVVISAPSSFSQSVQTLGLFATSNTTGTTSSQTVDARSITFAGGGIVSVGYNNGSVLVSATTAAQTAPLLSLYAVGNTTDSTSSGVIVAGSLSFDGAGAVSVGISGSSVVISAPVVTTAASGTVENLFALGNTTAQSSSTTATLTNFSVSGAGGVSIGYSTTAAGAGVMVISGATPVASAATMGQSVLGNTTALTSSQSRSITAEAISGAGIAAVGFSNGTLVISASSLQSVQTIGGFATGNTTGSSSSTTFDARSLTVSGAGIVSVGYSSNNILIVSANAGAQTAPTLSLFAVGNTTDSTSSGVIGAGSLSFDGAGIVSVGISGSSVVISAPATIASGTVDNRFALGNTTGQSSSTTATLSLFSVSGAGGVSVGYSTTGAGAGVLIVSGATTTPQTAPSLSLFAVGNTTTSVSSGVIGAGSLSFDGAGAVSVGISGSSVVISSPATVASGTAQNRAALGNTTSDSSSAVATLSILSVSGAGGVSVGYATNSSGVLVISGATTVASAGSMGQSAAGNTTGTTSSQSRTITAETLSGAGIVSVGFNAGSVVISATTAAQTAPTFSLFAVGNTTTSVSSGVIGAGSLSFDGAGAVSVGISGSSVVISSPATVASGTVMNRLALGNTTGQSSSSTATLSNISFSGAGGVSMGFSTTGAGAGVMIVSSPVASAAIGAANGVLKADGAGNVTAATPDQDFALPAWAVDLDFANDIYWDAPNNPPSAVGVTRASVGYIDTIAGVWSAVAANTLRRSNKGALIEEARTNSLRNNSTTGAVAASPGTLPTNWSVTTPTGLTRTITLGTTDGVEYIDINWAGSATSTAAIFLVTETTTGIASVNGEIWAGSCWLSNSATTGITTVATQIQMLDAGGISLGANDFVTGLLGAAWARVGATTAVSNASTADVRLRVSTNSITNGTVVNYTIRIGWPQMELVTNANSAYSSPIRTTSAAATRAADVSTLTLPPTFGTSHTLDAAGTPNQPTAFATDQYLVSANDASTTNQWAMLRLAATGVPNWILDAVKTGIGAIAWAVSTAGVVAAANAVSSQAGSFNGAAVTTGSSAVSPTGMTVVNIGCSPSGASQWNGYITRILIWPKTRLGNADVVNVGGTLPLANGWVVIPPLLSLYAVGNTTTSVSSGVMAAGSLSFDGAGAVSVGISGSSIVISSPATVASGTAQNRFALGNTTSDSSAAVGTLSVLSVSGAGGVSVGYATNSSGVLVISAAAAVVTVTALSLSVVGNTTSSTSSMTQAFGAQVLSGAGQASVGLSAGSIIVSVSNPMHSFFRPHDFDNASSVVAMPIGTFYCVPLDLQQPLSFNQVNFFGSRSFAVASLTLTTVAGSLTLTASAGWAASASAALYSRVNATQYSSVTTATMSYGMTQSFSISRTAASNTLSITHSFAWTVGTVSSASTFSTTSTTNTSTVYQVTGFTASTGFSSMMPLDIPFATTLTQSMFILALAQNSASATATGQSNATVAAGNWSQQAIMVTNSWGGFLSGPGGTARTSIAPFGWGTISAAGSSVPASLGVLLLSQTAATVSKPMIQLNLG